MQTKSVPNVLCICQGLARFLIHIHYFELAANHAIRGCVKTCRFAEEYHVRRKMFGAQRRALIWKICFNPVLAEGEH